MKPFNNPLPPSLPLRKPNTTIHPTPATFPSTLSLPFPTKAMMASPMLPADSTQTSRAQKNPTTAAAASPTPLRPPEQGLKCPRCDSPNTKFCYYNNYSLSQPRHFCKTCRRYWTAGGALRNVPVGGCCRKSKKSKSSASSSSLQPSSSRLTLDPIANFQLGMLPSGVFNSNQLIGFNYPISGVGIHNETFGFSSDRVINSNTHYSSIASSIESLSSINQDLHWKLQQQRMAMLFGGETQHKVPTPLLENQVEPISFQVAAESSKGEICGSRKGCVNIGENDTATAWFLENSYNMVSTNNNNTINNNNNDSINSSSNNNNTSGWNGIPTWSDMQQFTALP